MGVILHQVLAAAPAHLPALWVALLGAFALGIVHGVTPDEHTWPITFSYAIGSFSARRGMRSALLFSLAFTLQRALLSEAAYLGLLVVREDPLWNAAVYAIVGAAMVAAAVYVLRLRSTLHVHLWPPHVAVHRRSDDAASWFARAPSPAMAIGHGFIAGFGIGAFAVIVTTVLAPAMPSAALGWAPGALYGLGSTVVLAGAGALVAVLVRRGRLREELAQRVAQEAAGRTLLLGGALFVLAGLAGLADPAIMSAGIATGVHVHNLDRLDLGTALVAGVVLVAVLTMARATRSLRAAGASPSSALATQSTAQVAGPAPEARPQAATVEAAGASGQVPVAETAGVARP
jgi:hypothetical protein